MKSSFCIDLQRFMLIPTKFPLSPNEACFVAHRSRLHFFFMDFHTKVYKTKKAFRRMLSFVTPTGFKPVTF